MKNTATTGTRTTGKDKFRITDEDKRRVLSFLAQGMTMRATARAMGWPETPQRVWAIKHEAERQAAASGAGFGPAAGAGPVAPVNPRFCWTCGQPWPGTRR